VVLQPAAPSPAGVGCCRSRAHRPRADSARRGGRDLRLEGASTSSSRLSERGPARSRSPIVPFAHHSRRPAFRRTASTTKGGRPLLLSVGSFSIGGLHPVRLGDERLCSLVIGVPSTIKERSADFSARETRDASGVLRPPRQRGSSSGTGGRGVVSETDPRDTSLRRVPSSSPFAGNGGASPLRCAAAVPGALSGGCDRSAARFAPRRSVDIRLPGARTPAARPGALSSAASSPLRGPQGGPQRREEVTAGRTDPEVVAVHVEDLLFAPSFLLLATTPPSMVTPTVGR